jgi:hypothetical protein
MESLCVRRLNWPAKLRLGWAVRAAALVTLGFSQPLAVGCFAQDAISNPAPEIGNPAPQDDTPIDMSRGQWRERIAEAKRRSRQFALEHRRRPVFDPPSIADKERMASERILNDDSLEPGDIVSTDKGLSVFKGQSDQERRESDFVALTLR